MKDWPDLHFGMEPDPDLKEADALLEKANALLRKHRPTSQAAVRSDRVADDARDADVAPVPNELAEFLIDLDTELAREIELWFANELPQLVSNELDRMSERLRIEALGHMRATLIPALSERIAARLDKPRKS